MPNISSVNFLSPNIRSVSALGRASKQASITKQRTSGRSLQSNWVAVSSVSLLIMLGLLLLLHLYWVNTYAAKGFALSEAQKAITHQRDLQKKLLVQQSLLNSTSGLTEGVKDGLVAITEEEYLNSGNFAVK